MCVANKGKWGEEQIVSESWINEMTIPQVETGGDYQFGYYWWLDSSRNIHFMWGHGGQFAFIGPSKNLVVIVTSFPNTQGMYQIHADEILPVVDRIGSVAK